MIASAIKEYTGLSNSSKGVSYLNCTVSRATWITARINTTVVDAPFLPKINAFDRSLAVGALCEFLGLPVGLTLSIPGGLFELGFALWTLANPSSLHPLPSLPATDALTNAAQ